jgi:hypothetical protein
MARARRKRQTFLAIDASDLSPGVIKEFRGDISRGMTRDLRRFGDNLAPRLEDLYRSAAPVRSGRLRRSIQAKVIRGAHGGNMMITVGATLSRGRTGFNYLNVTRFGHRRLRIYPKRKKALRVRGVGPRASVRGFRPRSDWTTKVMPSHKIHTPTGTRWAQVNTYEEARRLMREEADRVGRNLLAGATTTGRSRLGSR